MKQPTSQDSTRVHRFEALNYVGTDPGTRQEGVGTKKWAYLLPRRSRSVSNPGGS